MPSYTLSLGEFGAVFEAAAFLPDQLIEVRRSERLELPHPIRFRAQIDTGASHTCISESIAERLSLSPVGRVLIRTPSSSSFPCFRYHVKISLTRSLSWEIIALGTPFLDDPSFECLIGRDILSQTVFVYDGPSSEFTLRY